MTNAVRDPDGGPFLDRIGNPHEVDDLVVEPGAERDLASQVFAIGQLEGTIGFDVRVGDTHTSVTRTVPLAQCAPVFSATQTCTDLTITFSGASLEAMGFEGTRGGRTAAVGRRRSTGRGES